MLPTPQPEFPPPRILLDTSVIFAGLKSNSGASYALLILCELGLLRPVTSPYLVAEIERILGQKAPSALLAFERLQIFINWEFSEDASPEQVREWEQIIEPNDAPILALGVSAKVQRLVTLDVKDFLKSPEVTAQSGLKIVTPRQVMVEIRQVLAHGFA
ncbi:MAG: PIN domain-containing protein [bacterium]|nr:PIN domain-containing protein [bacterium]